MGYHQNEIGGSLIILIKEVEKSQIHLRTLVIIEIGW